MDPPVSMEPKGIKDQHSRNDMNKNQNQNEIKQREKKRTKGERKKRKEERVRPKQSMQESNVTLHLFR